MSGTGRDGGSDGRGGSLERRDIVNQTQSTENAYLLRLYVAGRSSTGTAALRNLTRFCETWLHGRYELRVVDVLKEPELASADDIVATPTLVKQMPEPSARVFGILGDEDRLMTALGIEGTPGVTRRAATKPARAETWR